MNINIIYICEPVDFTINDTKHFLRPGVFAIYNGEVKFLTANMETSYEDAQAAGETYFEKKLEKEARANG